MIQLLASMRSFVLACCIALCRSQWPIPFVLGPDTVPNVEISLDAPSKPFPDVFDEVGKLEADREAQQAKNKDNMIRAFNKELASARLRTAAVLDGAKHQFDSVQEPAHAVEHSTSFLQSNIVKVVVGSEAHAPESARASIGAIEHARAQDEDSWFEGAIADMSHLTDVVVATLDAEVNAALKASSLRDSLSKSVSFLQMRDSTHDGAIHSREANVRIVGSTVPYPTIQSLVEALEAHRDVSEDFGKSQVLAMYLKLLDFENMLVDSGLNALAVEWQGAK